MAAHTRRETIDFVIVRSFYITVYAAVTCNETFFLVFVLLLLLLFFFFRGNGKKEHLNSATFTPRVVCRPLIGSLRSKRFQSSYGAKVRAGAKKKEGGRRRGRGVEETLARKPHDSGKRPLIFQGSVHL